MNSKFVDYYEILEISPNANSDTIDRVFRHLARRYHPDNQDTGDSGRFDDVVQAHNVLRDPVQRAQYDIQHNQNSGLRWKLAEEASDYKGIESDAEIQDKVLSILYVKRRRDINDPGIGDVELERLLDLPRALMEFHLWYLKEKGWIGRTENGLFAITVNGVDRAQVKKEPEPTKLLKGRRARD